MKREFGLNYKIKNLARERRSNGKLKIAIIIIYLWEAGSGNGWPGKLSRGGKTDGRINKIANTAPNKCEINASNKRLS